MALHALCRAQSSIYLLTTWFYPQVRTALGSKVSRERVGTELEGMFAGARSTLVCHVLVLAMPKALHLVLYGEMSTMILRKQQSSVA